MQPVAELALQMASVHPMIGLQVPDHRLDGVAPLDEFDALWREALGLTPVRDCKARVVGFHAAVAEVHHRGGGCGASVLHQDGGLLDLLVQGVAVERCAAERSCTDDKVALGCDSNTHLGAELERRASLALAEAVHLRCVPAVELGLATGLLAPCLLEDPLGLGEGAVQGLTRGLAASTSLARAVSSILASVG